MEYRMSVINDSVQHALNTVLLVDDVAANLDLLCSYLGDSYNTAIAKNGERAIQRAEILNPSLILLDIQMPGIDGYETCRRLKENEKTAHIPVIFMTALNETTDKVKGFEAGGVDYITKPVDVAELSARIKTHIALSTMSKELIQKNRELELNAIRQKRVEQILRHDLKSPLQAILTLPELLLEDENLTEEQVTMIEGVGNASVSMLDIINSSLALYKMESGVYKPKLTKVSVFPVLCRTFDALKGIFKNRTVRMILDGKEVTQDDECFVKAEELLLYTLFSNLIKNAIEASPDGERITISLESGNPVKISIANVGSVPASIRETFFDEFSTSGKEFGTGLGTYSAKLICDTLNGAIALDSSVENQTTIEISLPV